MGMCGRLAGAMFLSFAFFVFLPRNGHFCAHVSQKRRRDIAHKPVCVRVKGKGEGARCQNKKRLLA
jgi:hypothetical protein